MRQIPDHQLKKSLGQIKNSKLNINPEAQATFINNITKTLFGLRFDTSAKNPLSLMEMLCLALSAEGKTRHEMAELLAIRPNTVKTYETRLREKLYAKNRLHAFSIGIKAEFLLLD